MPYCPRCGEEVEPSDLVYEDNSFREDPEPDQTRLDELGRVSEGPGELDVWTELETSVDHDGSVEIDFETPDEPTLRPGETWNPNDPQKW